MNNGAVITYGEVNENKPFSYMDRVTSLSGTGTEYVQGEGPVVKVADLAAGTPITCHVYDLGTDRDSDAGVEITPAPTLTAANLFDALRTAGWARDTVGYNFRHDVAATYLAEAGQWRKIEYGIALADGSSLGLEVRVKTKPRQS